MDKIVVICTFLEEVNQAAPAVIETLFTDQLPATLTFISAVLGIVAQLIISWSATRSTQKNDAHKKKIECIRLFYIPLFNILLAYRSNLNALNQIADFNLFESNSSEIINVGPIYDQTLSCIKQLAELKLDNYYPINKKINKETFAMISYMASAQSIFALPPDKRSTAIQAMQLSVKGYDSDRLIVLIERCVTSYAR